MSSWSECKTNRLALLSGIGVSAVLRHYWFRSHRLLEAVLEAALIPACRIQ